MIADWLELHAAQEVERIARLSRKPFLNVASRYAQLTHIVVHVRNALNFERHRQPAAKLNRSRKGRIPHPPSRIVNVLFLHPGGVLFFAMGFCCWVSALAATSVRQR